MKTERKAIVAGGRHFLPDEKHKKWLVNILLYEQIDVIVSGGATGADAFGEWAAFNLGLKIEKYPAEWNNYGKAAGPMRNETMAKVADVCILFPGGKGTDDMKKRAINHGLKIIEWGKE